MIIMDIKRYIRIGVFIFICLLFSSKILLGGDEYRESLNRFYNSTKEGSLHMYLPLNYAELKPIMKTLYESKVIQVNFRKIEEKNEEDGKIIEAGELWFAEGKIFIRQLLLSNEDKEFNYNYATINNKIYEWYDEEKKGNILKRSSNDTLKYLLYTVDGAGLKMSVYADYKKHPDNFIVSEIGSEKRIMYKKSPDEGLLGISFLEDPLWLKGLYFKESENIEMVYEVDRPKEMVRIPEAISKLPVKMEWIHVDYGLEDKLDYL